MLIIDRDAEFVRGVFDHLDASLALIEDRFEVDLIISSRASDKEARRQVTRRDSDMHVSGLWKCCAELEINQASRAL